MFEQLGLIGCGMMGGSFALACKRAGLVKRVVGYSKSPSTTERAKQMGIIDVEAQSALMAVSNSDLVMLAVPVAATEATFKAIKHLVNPKVLMMDLGSTKRNVMDSARRVLRENVGVFVGAHPIAGKEQSGIEHADGDLFGGRQVILTPIEKTQTSHLKRATEVWKALGCDVVTMAPEAHDTAFAAVSHMPHLLAFAYVNAVSSQQSGADMLKLAGPGFRDFTRIAASDPEMWRDVMLANRHELMAQYKVMRRSLDSLMTMIDSENGDALEAAILQASHTRSNWRMAGKR